MEIGAGMQSASAADEPLFRMVRAQTTDEVLAVVTTYLSGWPADRVARLQCLDAGWAPFDANQAPLPLDSAHDVRRMYRFVHDQCLALGDAGLSVTPELRELERVLGRASARLTEIGTDGPSPAGPTNRAPSERAAAGPARRLRGEHH